MVHKFPPNSHLAELKSFTQMPQNNGCMSIAMSILNSWTRQTDSNYTYAYILSSLFDPDSISVDGVVAVMGSHVELLL